MEDIQTKLQQFLSNITHLCFGKSQKKCNVQPNPKKHLTVFQEGSQMERLQKQAVGSYSTIFPDEIIVAVFKTNEGNFVIQLVHPNEWFWVVDWMTQHYSKKFKVEFCPHEKHYDLSIHTVGEPFLEYDSTYGWNME